MRKNWIFFNYFFNSSTALMLLRHRMALRVKKWESVTEENRKNEQDSERCKMAMDAIITFFFKIIGDWKVVCWKWFPRARSTREETLRIESGSISVKFTWKAEVLSAKSGRINCPEAVDICPFTKPKVYIIDRSAYWFCSYCDHTCFPFSNLYTLNRSAEFL